MKKNVLITGSTDGIGKLVAIKLVEDGHKVYLHGRSQEKLNSVISEIIEATGNRDIKGFVADFSDFGSVRLMAQNIENCVGELDVLINNAGVYNSSVPDNKEGLDMRFTVNYLAPFLLTDKLLPLLKKGCDSRIINLGSAAQSSISYEALSGKIKLSEGETYAQSKLALTMWSLYLAETVPEISVIAVNPGSLLNTKMAREAFGNYWSSADKGADIIYRLAVSDEYKGITGEYFDNDRGDFGRAHSDAYDANGIDQLIRVTTDLFS